MWSVFRKFRKLFSAQQKRKFVLLFFLMLFGAFLEVLGVSLIVPLVSVVMQEDIIETNELVGEICEVFHIYSERNFLICCIILLVLVFIFKDLYLIFQIYVQNRLIYNNKFRVQQRLMNTYLNRGYEYYLNANSGEIVRVVQQDVNNTFALFSSMWYNPENGFTGCFIHKKLQNERLIKGFLDEKESNCTGDLCYSFCRGAICTYGTLQGRVRCRCGCIGQGRARI